VHDLTNNKSVRPLKLEIQTPQSADFARVSGVHCPPSPWRELVELITRAGKIQSIPTFFDKFLTSVSRPWEHNLPHDEVDT